MTNIAPTNNMKDIRLREARVELVGEGGERISCEFRMHHIKPVSTVRDCMTRTATTMISMLVGTNANDQLPLFEAEQDENAFYDIRKWKNLKKVQFEAYVNLNMADLEAAPPAVQHAVQTKYYKMFGEYIAIEADNEQEKEKLPEENSY